MSILRSGDSPTQLETGDEEVFADVADEINSALLE